MGKDALKRHKRKLLFIKRLCCIISIIIAIALISIFYKRKEKTKSDVSQFEQNVPIEVVQEPEEPKTTRASILSAGDIIMHDPLLTSNHYKKDNGVFEYDAIFSYIEEHYEKADYTVINLESTISDGNYKGYPRFRAPASIVTALANSHVDLCLLANNHIYDNDTSGFQMTMNAVEQNKLQYLGTRKDLSEKPYLIQEVNGIKVGFFNYVFDTGAQNGQNVSINSIPVSNEIAPLINTFSYANLQGLYDEIQNGLNEMKEADVEYTIAYIHWGIEYETKERTYQQKIAQQLCELGIDALIGGHPHVIQPVDILTNSTGDHQMLCAYSLGNHLSNQYRERLSNTMPSGHTEDGLAVELTLEKTDDGTVSLIEADFIPTWVYRTPNEPDDGNPEFFILPLDEPDDIIQKAGNLNIAADVEESLNRTNEIIGVGVEKIQSALPLQ